jgi:hypothetical protein
VMLRVRGEGKIVSYTSGQMGLRMANQVESYGRVRSSNISEDPLACSDREITDLGVLAGGAVDPLQRRVDAESFINIGLNSCRRLGVSQLSLERSTVFRSDEEVDDVGQGYSSR